MASQIVMKIAAHKSFHHGKISIQKQQQKTQKQIAPDNAIKLIPENENWINGKTIKLVQQFFLLLFFRFNKFAGK